MVGQIEIRQYSTDMCGDESEKWKMKSGQDKCCLTFRPTEERKAEQEHHKEKR